MRIKCRPEDFQVCERLNLALGRTGPHSVYRLRKRLWNTLDVIRELERRHGLMATGRAGLKDRYSLSTQYISVRGQGPRKIVEKNYQLDYCGRSQRPVSRRDLLGNEFLITVRDLTKQEADAILRGLPLVQQFGYANYYDEQRLGSARHREGFVARKLIDGHFNGALKLYLATPSFADPPKVRRTKRLIAENWGQWAKITQIVPREARPVIEHLIRKPRDFKGAVAQIPRAMLELFIAAYQAWFWNDTLATLVRQLGAATNEIKYSHGQLVFWSELSANQDGYLTGLQIPAVAPRTQFNDRRIEAIVTKVLRAQGLKLADLKFKTRIHGIYFKPYLRSARIVPQQLTVTAPEPDELYPDKLKLTLGMFLPAGAYATILLKRLVMTQ